LIDVLALEKPIEDENQKILGTDPKTGLDIVATLAKYGPVLKIQTSKSKSKYAPIKEPFTYDNITLEEAIKIMSYPKELGRYGRKKVFLKKGKYGFYLVYGKDVKISIDSEDITLDEAKKLIDNKSETAVSPYQAQGNYYTIAEGPYGKYFKVTNDKGVKKYNIPYPKKLLEADITTEKLTELTENYFNKKKTRRFYKKKK
jgi:DNA topoisomerase-1